MSELLATHVNAAIDALPAAVCVGSEATATRALRRVLGFCQLLASRLPAVLTADRLWEERALDLYEQQKQMLAIRDVSTVAVLTGADARPATLFRVNYRHLSETAAALLLRTVETLWRYLPASDELVLTLLADCGRGDCEAAWLAQFLFQEPSPARDEFLDASLDSLRRTLQRPAANAPLLLLSLTRLTLRSDRLPATLPSLLALLFYHQAQSETPGPLQTALWSLADALELPSPAALALRHADYLLDSALLQLRLADALTSSALEAAAADGGDAVDGAAARGRLCSLVAAACARLRTDVLRAAPQARRGRRGAATAAGDAARANMQREEGRREEEGVERPRCRRWWNVTS